MGRDPRVCRHSDHRDHRDRPRTPRTEYNPGAARAGQLAPGQADECPKGDPSNYLVVRNFPRSVTEEELVNGVCELLESRILPAKEPTPAPTGHGRGLKSTALTHRSPGIGAKAGSLVRVFLMRDAYDHRSWGYGFAEFRDVEDAKAAMAKFNFTPRFAEKWLGDKVKVAYAHLGVFMPVYDERERRSLGEHFLFSPVYNQHLKVKYWSDRGYPSRTTVSYEQAGHKTLGGPTLELDYGEPTDKKDATSLSARASERVDANAKMCVSSSKEGQEIKKIKKDKGPGSIAIAKLPQMQLWTQKAAEIRGQDLCKNTTTTSGIDLKINPVETMHTLDGVSKKDSVPCGSYVSYANRASLVCHLCARRFRHRSTLLRHELKSPLHRSNLANSATKIRAVGILYAQGLTPIVMIPKPRTQYRDRANERRQAFNQPNRPKATRRGKGKSRGKQFVTNKEDASPAPPKPSKGANMLSRMGWNSGAGLGTNGNGIAQAIAPGAYAPGVGLGAEGSHLGDAAEEAQARTRANPLAFIEKTRERARKRFEKMA